MPRWNEWFGFALLRATSQVAFRVFHCPAGIDDPKMFAPPPVACLLLDALFSLARWVDGALRRAVWMVKSEAGRRLIGNASASIADLEVGERTEQWYPLSESPAPPSLSSVFCRKSFPLSRAPLCDVRKH